MLEPLQTCDVAYPPYANRVHTQTFAGVRPRCRSIYHASVYAGRLPSSTNRMLYLRVSRSEVSD